MQNVSHFCFIDGDKKQAIFANHMLITQAKGLIAIPTDQMDEYSTLMLSYYESIDITLTKQLLKEKSYIKFKSS